MMTVEWYENCRLLMVCSGRAGAETSVTWRAGSIGRILLLPGPNRPISWMRVIEQLTTWHIAIQTNKPPTLTLKVT